MSNWDFLELEEQIGHFWHRLVGNANSYPNYQDAAVSLDSIRTSLSVYFRGLGGAPGIELTAGAQHSSKHRLKLLQRLGKEQESMPSIEGNSERLLLPATIAFFPSQALNRRLYFWLVAFFAVSEEPVGNELNDPLRADLAFLHCAYWTCLKVCDRFPGLLNDYRNLCMAISEQRPKRRLPKQENAVEAVS